MEFSAEAATKIPGTNKTDDNYWFGEWVNARTKSTIILKI
jgi:hypothetical protein